MDIINIFYYLAVILIFAKSFGLLARKLGLPQVAGMVVAGVIIGLLSRLHNDDNVILSTIFMKPTSAEKEILNAFSQVGVVLILFSSGLETNLDDLKHSGLAATVIALFGVLVPIALGALGAFISGAGPSIVAIVYKGDRDYIEKAQALCETKYPHWKAVQLRCDEVGTTVKRL